MITNAASPLTSGFRTNRFLQGLLIIFAVAWAATAIAPLDRFDWLLENLLVFLAVGSVVHFYRSQPLSGGCRVGGDWGL